MHALIPDEIHDGIIQRCNFSVGANSSDECEDYKELAEDATGNIFPYDIYAPLCSYDSSESSKLPQVPINLITLSYTSNN